MEDFNELCGCQLNDVLQEVLKGLSHYQTFSLSLLFERHFLELLYELYKDAVPFINFFAFTAQYTKDYELLEAYSVLG